MLRQSLYWRYKHGISYPGFGQGCQALYVQLNNAMRAHDMQAVAIAMGDLAELGYFIHIVTRHIAKNGEGWR